jgi:hypothetical protein
MLLMSGNSLEGALVHHDILQSNHDWLVKLHQSLVVPSSLNSFTALRLFHMMASCLAIWRAKVHGNTHLLMTGEGLA